MIVILDTHALIWWHGNAKLLSQAAATAINDPQNRVYISVDSVWEIVIKQQLGMLNLSASVGDLVKQQLDNGLSILDVKLDHSLALEQLPVLHKDPFDRLLIAQTIIENASLISKDPAIQQYSIPTIW